MPLYHSPNLRGNVVSKNKISVMSLMPNRLQNGNPAYYPSEYIMLNTIHTLRDSSRPRSGLTIQLHSERLLAVLRKVAKWYNSGCSFNRILGYLLLPHLHQNSLLCNDSVMKIMGFQCSQMNTMP